MLQANVMCNLRLEGSSFVVGHLSCRIDQLRIRRLWSVLVWTEHWKRMKETLEPLWETGRRSTDLGWVLQGGRWCCMVLVELQNCSLKHALKVYIALKKTWHLHEEHSTTSFYNNALSAWWISWSANCSRSGEIITPGLYPVTSST